MYLNHFFTIKFYNLNSGWVKVNQSLVSLNRYLYYDKELLSLFFTDKSFFYLKKTFFLFQSIIKSYGSVLFFSPNGYYFKRMQLNSFNIRELTVFNISKACFSNHLYRDFSCLPDLIIIFNSMKHYLFLKQLKKLGILTIVTIEDMLAIPLIEYPILLGSFSYFINYFMLNIYSRLVQLTKI